MATSLAERLRPRLIRPGDATGLEVHGRTDAGVLVPLFCDADGDIHAVFTRRREDLRRHAGEISFPGGKADPKDHDLLATALREAQEEIGLNPHEVELVGALQPTPTFVTSYAIYPFVGVIASGREWTLSPREVAEVLELRMRDVRDGYERRRLIRRGLPIRTDTYVVDRQVIWGATARIVGDLLDRLEPLL
jgi:8-oxo-dGTP pyrophosphatase MutT (NUDIX family)